LKDFAYPESVLMHYPKVVPFIAHKDNIVVEADTYDDRRHVEPSNLRKDLRGALAVINGVVPRIVIRLIVKRKRELLERRIRASFAKGEHGKVPHIRYASLKITGLRVALVGFNLVTKIGFKLIAKMKGAAL
jgi:hypothetical protein